MRIKIKFTDQPLGFDPQNNMYIRALRRRCEVELSDDPDLVFYSVFGTEFLKYPDSVRIFIANEPVLPNFNDCDYAIGPAHMRFGERYYRHPPLIGYGERMFWELFLPPAGEDAFDRPFCNFIYSNASNGAGARLRVEFCRKLAAYKSVDCLGSVLRNAEGGVKARYKKSYAERELNTDWEKAKIDTQSRYKFTIAFENTRLPGWATEKLIDPLLAHSIPIYWGDPAVAEYFNPKAFINCADYGDDLDAVVRAVIELDNDRERYMRMLREPPLREDFPYDWQESLADFLDAVARRGRAPFDKNPIGFETVSVQSVGSLCREGKMGLHKIAGLTAQALSGWAHYKLHRAETRRESQ